MVEKLKNRKWKVLSSKSLINLGTWLNVQVDTVELPNGICIPSWIILHFPHWINVIALTKDGQFVMIDQYRHALGETHYELVAGVVDPGETPLQAAQRELSEETGFGGGTWQLFMTLSPNPTNHDNLSFTFLAVDVERISTPHQEASEDIHVHIIQQDDVYRLLQDGEIVQALHAAPLWKYFASKR